MRLSGRLPWSGETASPLLSLREEREREGKPVLSLVSTDPTSAELGLPWDEIAAPLGDASLWKSYRPDPHGTPAARRALSAFYRKWGEEIDPERIFLSASTSELYSWLFQTLCDPGDAVLVPEPGYPLFEEIAALAAVKTVPAPLAPRSEGGRLKRWACDFAAWSAALRVSRGAARAVVVVAPHNPTGAAPSASEWIRIAEFCRANGLALVVDEVFRLLADGGEKPACDWGALGIPVAVLSGLSKWLAGPQLKLSWMRLYGPEDDLRAWNDALEHAADACLNVGGPAQASLGTWLELVPRASALLKSRVERNREAFLATFGPLFPKVRIMSEPAGWYALLRVDGADEEELTLRLLGETGLFVHPGFFYDFEDEGFLVLSLVGEEREFARRAGLLRDWLAKHYF